MTALAPSALDSRALAARLSELACDKRNVDVDFVLHLDEFDRRRAYLEAGYGSLWAYCLEALHLREGAAGRRIQAMKVLRRFPSLESALRDGRLSLSTIALLGQVLTPENLEDLLARAAFKTKADVDHLVASIQPRPAPKDGIRKLPDRRAEAAVPEISSLPLAAPAESVSTAAPLVAVGNNVPAPTPAVAVDPAPLPSPAPRSRRSEIRPVSETEWSLRVTLDDACKADLETLRNLLSHKISDGDLAGVLHEAIRCAIDKHGKRRGTVAPSRKTSRIAPPTAPASNEPRDTTERARTSARPTAQVRREVTARDGCSCAWVGEDGRRCGSTWQLELDHVQTAALGGKATVEEMRVLCRPHNMLHAEQVFGREYMAQFRRDGAPSLDSSASG